MDCWFTSLHLHIIIINNISAWYCEPAVSELMWPCCFSTVKPPICHLIHRHKLEEAVDFLPLHHTVDVNCHCKVLLLLNTGHVLFPLIVAEGRTTGPLTLREKLRVIKVSVHFTSDLGIWVFMWLHYYPSWFLWAGLAEVCVTPGTGLLCRVLYQPGLGKFSGALWHHIHLTACC